MSTELATAPDEDAQREAAAGALAHVLGTGDLYQLTNQQRVEHYLSLCRSLSLNPLSRPFEWIEFAEPDGQKKLELYLRSAGADQLLRLHYIRVRVIRRDNVGELHVVEVEGTTPTGRTGTASKYVPLTGRSNNGTYRLSGIRLANAYMKAETGARRRLALAMIGLAAPPDLDERSGARVMTVDAHGNVLEHPTEDQKYLAEHPEAARAIGEPTLADHDPAPYGDLPDQGPTEAELTPPKRSGPRATLRPSADEVARWVKTWHATVDKTSLDHDDERHRFVEQWTDGRTDSLVVFFETATKRQAEELLAHVRALVEDERKAIAVARAAMAENDEEAF